MITWPKPEARRIWLSLRHHTKHAEAPPLAGVAIPIQTLCKVHVRDFCTLSPSYSPSRSHHHEHEGKGKNDFYLDLCIEARVVSLATSTVTFPDSSWAALEAVAAAGAAADALEKVLHRGDAGGGQLSRTVGGVALEPWGLSRPTRHERSFWQAEAPLSFFSHDSVIFLEQYSKSGFFGAFSSAVSARRSISTHHACELFMAHSPAVDCLKMGSSLSSSSYSRQCAPGTTPRTSWCGRRSGAWCCWS